MPAGAAVLSPPPITSTPGATRSVLEMGAVFPAGDWAYFYTYDLLAGEQLWRTDGTQAGTLLVKTFPPGQLGTRWLTHRAKGTDSGKLYFVGYTPNTGYELWFTDGTAAGTRIVKEIYPGRDSGMSSGTPMVTIGDDLYFIGNQQATGNELWKSNGTEAGTFLVRDFSPPSYSTPPEHLTAYKGQLYFRAAKSNVNSPNGYELWKTDGTVGGTVMVTDRVGGTSPFNLLVADGWLYFRGLAEQSYGHQLYRTDGTRAGTELVKSLLVGTSGSVMETPMTSAGGLVYFVGDSPSTGKELWKTDGTTEGTVMVKDVYPGSYRQSGENYPNSSQPRFLTTVGNNVFFEARSIMDQRGLTSFNTEIWGSDGTEQGTVRLPGMESVYSVTGMTAAGGKLYIHAMMEDFLQKLICFDPETQTSTFFDASPTLLHTMTPLGNRLLFSRFEPGQALWATDGTKDGTALLKAGTAGAVGSAPDSLAVFQNEVFFSASDPARGRELWRTQGGGASGTLVSDIMPGIAGSLPAKLFVFKDRLYFHALTSTHGIELWSSDGTPAGTRLLKDIEPGKNGYNVTGMISYGDFMFFRGTTTAAGSELWRTDGTSAGTKMVKNMNPGGNSFLMPSPLFLSNDRLYMYATDGETNGQLWVLGSPGGTPALFKHINGNANGHASVSYMTTIGSSMFFAATNGGGPADNGSELWKSNGSASGTSMLKDIIPGRNSSSPQMLMSLNGLLLFHADNGTQGRELWKSDGTAAGTVLVKDIHPNGSGITGATNMGMPGASIVQAGTLAYFAANDGVNGLELWKTDGTTEGTAMVKNINASGDSGPSNLTEVNGTLFFTAYTPDQGVELWCSDGTPGGTRLVADMTGDSESSSPKNFLAKSGALYFTASTRQQGNELYRLSLGPDLVVTHNGLKVDAAEGLNFGLNAPAGSVQKTLLLRNIGLQDLTGLSVAVTGASSAQFNVSSLAMTTLAPGASTAVTVTWVPSGQVDQAVVSVSGGQAPAQVLNVPLRGGYAGLALASRPQSRIVRAGEDAGFEAQALTMGVPAYSWKKNGVIIPGQASGTLSLPAVTAADVGIYAVTASGATGTPVTAEAGLVLLASPPRLNVIKVAGPLTLKVTVTAPKGAVVRYQWLAGGAFAYDDFFYSGTTGPALSIRNDPVAGGQETREGIYSCIVTVIMPSGEVVQGDTGPLHVAAAREKPLLNPVGVQTHKIGQAVSLQLAGVRLPAGFAVSGLPPGLKYNPLNQRIEGRPTVAKLSKTGLPEPYQVKVAATNFEGSSQLETVMWTILPLPTGSLGTFYGIVDRHALVNGLPSVLDGLGGTVKMTTTATGSFTGTLVLAGKSLAFKGSLDIPSLAAAPRASVRILRTGLAPVDVEFTIDESSETLNGLVKVGAHTAALSAILSPWGAKLKLATSQVGQFNCELVPDLAGLDAATLPEGRGYVVMTVSMVGAVTWSGRLADDSIITGSTGLSRVWDAPFHLLLHKGTSSAQGWLQIDQGTKEVDGTLDWMKARQPDSLKTRSYKPGFARHHLTVTGGSYLKPAKNQMLLALDPEANPNVRLKLSSGGLASTLAQSFFINTAGTAVVPVNSLGTKVTVNAATGLFSGTFTQPGTGSKVRKATFFGVLLPHQQKGEGYFLLPQLGDSQASPATTDDTSPLRSGRVWLEKMP